MEKELKDAKIRMIRTKADDALFLQENGSMTYKKGYFTQEYLSTIGKQSFQIYFTMELKPIVTDWYITFDGRLVQWTQDLEDLVNSHNAMFKESLKLNTVQKVIATSDKSIKYSNYIVSPVSNYLEYPKPSSTFMIRYADEFNKGNQIKECKLEMLNDEVVTDCDNEFHPIVQKDTFTREEVIEFADYVRENDLKCNAKLDIDIKYSKDLFDIWVKERTETINFKK